MDRETYLVQPNDRGKIKFLHLMVEGDTMTTEWGLIGGAVQETSNTYGYINEGKSNELTPEDAAIADFERKRDKKIKEGYREVESLELAEDTAVLDEIDFDNPPTSFAPSKPIKTISDGMLNALIKSGNASIQIKENGLCHFIVVTSTGTPKILTRRMDDHTPKYPSIVEATKELIQRGSIGPKTILMAEFVTNGFKRHMDSFNWMQRISKSNTNKGKCLPSQVKAHALQKEHRVRACVFHIPYLNGDKLWDDPYYAVYDEMLHRIPPKSEGHHFFIPPTINNVASAEELDEFLRKREGIIEGAVVWDFNDAIEITFNGKPRRRACYKRKIIYEDDVIAYDWMEGQGDHQGGIGALYIGKLHHETGEMVPMGRVGSGLKDTEIDPSLWKFPCVVNIEYQQRFPDGPYQFPAFKGIHGDKIPEEVTTRDDVIFGNPNIDE